MTPAVYLSATRKSSGKTTLAAGICGAMKARGFDVQAFKKGPDYIDPMWLGRLSGRPCFNLDFRTQSNPELKQAFVEQSSGTGFVVVEGNKGLFDGMDIEGSDSNAAMAKLLGLPVVLVIDGEGMTRGVAPLLNGYRDFDRELNIAGVILNNLGGSRHESKLRQVVEHYSDIPVVGALQRDPSIRIAERHLGLTTDQEDPAFAQHCKALTAAVEAGVDVEKLLDIARSAGAVEYDPVDTSSRNSLAGSGLRIGIARDSAFCFYYPDDLAAMESRGAKLVFFNTLDDPQLPEVEALFIGGGFPETHGAALAANRSMRSAIRSFATSGKPVYAECGGLMYLCRSLRWGDKRWPMAGVIDADIEMTGRPVGRGYVRLTATAQHPWLGADNSFSPLDSLNAHEFHYSKVIDLPADTRFGYRVERGFGIDGRHDGLIQGGIFATYAHMRNTASNPWVERFLASIVRNCSEAA